jgi:hypothetical protein
MELFSMYIHDIPARFEGPPKITPYKPCLSHYHCIEIYVLRLCKGM